MIQTIFAATVFLAMSILAQVDAGNNPDKNKNKNSKNNDEIPDDEEIPPSVFANAEINIYQQSPNNFLNEIDTTDPINASYPLYIQICSNPQQNLDEAFTSTVQLYEINMDELKAIINTNNIDDNNIDSVRTFKQEFQYLMNNSCPAPPIISDSATNKFIFSENDRGKVFQIVASLPDETYLVKLFKIEQKNNDTKVDKILTDPNLFITYEIVLMVLFSLFIILIISKNKFHQTLFRLLVILISLAFVITSIFYTIDLVNNLSSKSSTPYDIIQNVLKVLIISFVTFFLFRYQTKSTENTPQPPITPAALSIIPKPNPDLTSTTGQPLIESQDKNVTVRTTNIKKGNPGFLTKFFSF
jgi:hypothetical protein